MKLTESDIKVMKTASYEYFKTVDGNRTLNYKKIARIIKEIKAGNDILDHVPILVTMVGGRLHVLDGQHRLEICKQLNRPVHFIIRDQMSLHDVAKINSNVEKWKATDFIRCYKKAGNPHYRKISDFMEVYEMPLSVTLKLLHHGIIKSDGGAKSDLKDAFERGTYEVKHYRQAVDIAESCKQFCQFNDWNSAGFVIAICKVLQADKADFDELVDKFKSAPGKLLKQNTWKDYLTNLEEIYNHGFSKRRIIY